VILGIAHEIGNQLGALQLRLQMLKQDAACRQAQGRNLEAMESILNEASELVQRAHILGMTTLVSPPEGGDHSLVDLQQVVAEAIQLVGNGLRVQARRAGIELRIENAVGRLPPARGVPEDIRRALVNLLLGARQAFPRGGTIRVVGSRAAEAVILRIEDSRRKRGTRQSGQAGAPLELRLPCAATKPGRPRSAVA
jgi:signal transduction histidine kinase